MMGVYIKGMEMPKTCFGCKFSRITPSFYAWCSLTEKCYPADDPPPEDCPLIPVPPHGRLIDADALKPYMLNEHYKYRLVYDADEVANAPTIIEVEEHG